MMTRLDKTAGRFACLTLAAAMITPMVGCGDDGSEGSSFADTYQVLVHTRNNDGCDSEGTPFDGDRYFRLEESDGTLVYRTCEDAENCSSSTNTSKSFTEQDSEGWRNVAIDTTDVRLGCDVTLTERIARLTDSDLRIEQRTYQGEIEREQGADCTDELVLSNRGALTCERYEVVVAVPAE